MSTFADALSTALKNNFVSAALMGTAAPMLIPKRVRPGLVRSDLMLGLFTGVAWLAVGRMIDKHAASNTPASALPPVEAVNGIGNMFNEPWTIQQAFTGGRNPVYKRPAPVRTPPMRTPPGYRHYALR